MYDPTSRVFEELRVSPEVTTGSGHPGQFKHAAAFAFSFGPETVLSPSIPVLRLQPFESWCVSILPLASRVFFLLDGSAVRFDRFSPRFFGLMWTPG